MSSRPRRPALAGLRMLLIGLVALVVPAPAWAQGDDADERAREAERRAVDDINPAVDFSPELGRARAPAESTESDGAAASTQPPARGSSSQAEPERARAASSGALDTLNLGTTSITGNQELPRVLYIVPWKQSDLGDLVGRPVDTLLDEVLAPVDPEVFERHLDYYETLYGESQEDSSQ